MLTINAETLLHMLSLEQIDELRRHKLESLAAEKAERIARVEELRQQTAELESATIAAVQSIDELVSKSATAESTAENARLAVTRQIFKQTPIYPVSATGKPLPVNHGRVMEFVRQARSLRHNAGGRE